MKKYFCAILCEIENKSLSIQEQRIKSISKNIRQIASNVFILEFEPINMMNTGQILHTISGDEKYLTVVLEINTRTEIAWCLFHDNSNYLLNVLKDIYGNKNEESK